MAATPVSWLVPSRKLGDRTCGAGRVPRPGLTAVVLSTTLMERERAGFRVRRVRCMAKCSELPHPRLATSSFSAAVELSMSASMLAMGQLCTLRHHELACASTRSPRYPKPWDIWAQAEFNRKLDRKPPVVRDGRFSLCEPTNLSDS